MPYLNKTTLVGVVDQSPKIGTLGAGGPQVMKFTVRVGEGFGERRKSHWFNVSYIAKKYADFRFPELQPKDHVIIDGKLSTYESANPNGARTRHVYIEAMDVKPFRIQYDEDHGQRPSGPPAANGGGGDTDMPF